MSDKQKVCRVCKETKTLDYFYKNREYADGHMNLCIACQRAYMRAHDQTERGREVQRRKSRRAEARRRDKHNVNKKVLAAIKSGKLIRPDGCEDCGKQGRIEGHHEDYAKPLEVIWLCPRCHKLREGKIVDPDLLEIAS